MTTAGDFGAGLSVGAPGIVSVALGVAEGVAGTGEGEAAPAV